MNDQGSMPADVPFDSALHQLITDAGDEASRRRHEYIGTEHLVLALSRPTADATVLRALAIDPQSPYARLDGIVQSGSMDMTPTANRPFTSRTKQAFSFAAESAQGDAGGASCVITARPVSTDRRPSFS